MASNNGWTWSEEHADWYYAMKDPFGRVIYIWSKQGAQQPPVQTPSSHVQHLSVTYQSQNRAYGAPQSGLLTNGYTGNVPDATQHSPQYRTSSAFPTLPSNNVLPPSLPHVNPFAMPPAVPENKRVPGLIEGTPQRGWVEPLDPSYKMRTGQEAHDFFVKGRVFSMLWAEAASETAARQAAPDGTVYRYQKPSHDYTPGRFPGEFVYSNIRRFVIMRVKKDAHFVYVCPITTYSKRGTLKPGCKASEHTIVYFRGTDPDQCYLDGEYEKGMKKEPIEIERTDPQATMHRTSRLRFGMTYPVAWNVKVKEIGKVSPHHMSKLIRYWKEEDFYESE